MRKWKDVKRKKTMREMGNIIHEPIMNFLFTGGNEKTLLAGDPQLWCREDHGDKAPPACTQSSCL
jgi:hypothetical protein